MQSFKRDVTVIGAGIVGTVCANYLLREGHSVTIIDPNDPGSMTSFGNTGGISPASVVPVSMPGILRDIPKWLLDPTGPLHLRLAHLPSCLPWLIKFVRAGSPKRVRQIARALGALNMPTFDAYEPLLKDAGLEHLFYRTGQLFVYRSERSFDDDGLAIELKRETGVRVDILDQNEIRQFEPSLSSSLRESPLHRNPRSLQRPVRSGEGACRKLRAARRQDRQGKGKELRVRFQRTGGGRHRAGAAQGRRGRHCRRYLVEFAGPAARIQRAT